MTTASASASASASGSGSGSVDLSILVICRNGAAKVSRFLPSVGAALEGAGIAGELVFVDDASTDGTAAAARAAVPWARVVSLPSPRGSSGARNAAAGAARGRWLLLCDDDVELSANGLTRLWAARDPRLCLVPLVRDLAGALQNAITATWRRGDLKLVTHAEPVPELGYPDSACMLLTAELYRRAGGFDERYQPNCYEDVAFGFALVRAGARSVMAPDVTVTHFVHGTDPSGIALRTAEQHLEEKRERIYRNRWLFDLLELEGWRRFVAVALGLPRTALESIRVGSLAPARGYAQGWVAFLRSRRSGTALGEAGSG